MKMTVHILLGLVLRLLWCVPLYFMAGTILGLDYSLSNEAFLRNLTTYNPYSVGVLVIVIIGIIYDVTGK